MSKKIAIAGTFYEDVQFFRFYNDGTFLDCLIKENNLLTHQEKISGWFQREKMGEGIFQGTYTMKGKTIFFSTISHFGHGRSLDYEGKYQKDCLILNSLYRNTGRRIAGRVFTRFQ